MTIFIHISPEFFEGLGLYGEIVKLHRLGICVSELESSVVEHKLISLSVRPSNTSSAFHFGSLIVEVVVFGGSKVSLGGKVGREEL